MHHLAVKSNLFDSDSDAIANKLGSAANGRPLCPKPRRLVGPAIPDFLNPHPRRCSNHSQPYTDARSGILNLIPEKNVEEKECKCSNYSGSPPGRTDNPLVHDLQFVQYHPVELVPPPLTRTKLSDKFSFSSASPL